MVGGEDDIGFGPMIRVVQADNAGPMTGAGTNSWIIGREFPMVLDPGPDEPAHLERLLAATGGRVHRIILTHAHADHADLAPALRAATGAPILAIDRGAWPKRPRLLADLPKRKSFRPFRPDIALIEGARIETGEVTLEVVHLPGHSPDHLALGFGELLFCGDLVLPDRPSVVAAPEGSIPHMLAALKRLSLGPWERGLPGHGAVIEDLPARSEALLAHRLARLDQIRRVLSAEFQPAREIFDQVYSEAPAALHGIAFASLLCQLAALEESGDARLEGPVERLRVANP